MSPKIQGNKIWSYNEMKQDMQLIKAESTWNQDSTGGGGDGGVEHEISLSQFANSWI